MNNSENCGCSWIAAIIAVFVIVVIKQSSIAVVVAMRMLIHTAFTEELAGL